MSRGHCCAELRCSRCAYTTLCGPEDMLARLLRAGMLKRADPPDDGLLFELFNGAAGRFRCPECDCAGLLVRPAPALGDEDDWDTLRSCQRCGRPIPPERLELFPETELCVNCQRAAEDGTAADEPDYCPKCGSVLSLRKSHRGITRYEMKCVHCG